MRRFMDGEGQQENREAGEDLDEVERRQRADSVAQAPKPTETYPRLTGDLKVPGYR